LGGDDRAGNGFEFLHGWEGIRGALLDQGWRWMVCGWAVTFFWRWIATRRRDNQARGLGWRKILNAHPDGLMEPRRWAGVAAGIRWRADSASPQSGNEVAGRLSHAHAVVPSCDG
jgi:hypothetical protein